MRPMKKAFIRQSECVACGCCACACPKQAIQIYKGIYAQVDAAACIGCGACAKACPAGVIDAEVCK